VNDDRGNECQDMPIVLPEDDQQLNNKVAEQSTEVGDY